MYYAACCIILNPYASLVNYNSNVCVPDLRLMYIPVPVENIVYLMFGYLLKPPFWETLLYFNFMGTSKISVAL